MPHFLILYLFCLLGCLGSVEVLRWSIGDALVEVSAVETRILAIPPKPKGVEDTQVSGEDGGFRYTEAVCAKQKPEHKDICYHQLARQRSGTDLNGALQTCNLIQDKMTVHECQSDVAEGYAAFDRDAALAVCPSIENPKWRDQCVFGIAYSYAVTDSEWAFSMCDKSGRWRDFCRHDVIGEMAVIDTAKALGICGKEEGDLLTRKTCWHGIGKYLARRDVDRAYAACEQVPSGPNNLYIENCIHGLGWGASETLEESFIPQCDRSGPQKDSCLLGVAYNLRRIDRGRGLDVCQSVERPDLKRQCERFVGSKR